MTILINHDMPSGHGPSALTRWLTVAAGYAIAAGAAVALAGMSACSVLNDVAPPSNLVDTGQVESQASALAMYNGAIYYFDRNYGGGATSGFDGSFMGITGVFSDEYIGVVGGSFVTVDTHTGTPQVDQGPYDGLQNARRLVDEAIKHLVANGGTLPKSYTGEMHALKGYIYLALSELYCSGVPFSTLVGTGLVTYGVPETTEEMNRHAVAQFDSAVTYASDSARILQLAAVGKGRALLNLGEFDSAKAAVASVPTTFAYLMTYNATYPNYIQPSVGGNGYYSMADREGTNGLDFVSTTDARMARVAFGGKPYIAKIPTGTTSLPLANGVEARLIEAEAALRAGDVAAWTAALNTLRASGGTTPVPALTADSTTTAADTLRVNVMFRERAFWLFGLGHRQGDMRRLIRQYGRLPEKTYPIGVVTIGAVPVAYGTTPVMDVPQAEIDNNPKYHGCLNHDA